MAKPIQHCDMCGSDLGPAAIANIELPGFQFCSQMCVDNAKEEVNFASRFNEPVEKPYAAAHEVLEMGAKHMKDRAVTYDNADGERSMYKSVYKSCMRSYGKNASKPIYTDGLAFGEKSGTMQTQ